ncbi:MAG: 50S ribosomal protein L11 methyltransferase [Crocinitomicaceae bacterium]|nr:50S ribosomal protein L11 methyltransferase [Crocinitomicaceae bacterium]
MPENKFQKRVVSEIQETEGVGAVSFNLIRDQNWNAKWEENFDPVIIEDKVVIKAPFHKEQFNTNLEIIIQPQMSFGTGHHQTTWLMAKRLYELDLKGKDVLDMGTGTGVLAILAEKRGAAKVFAPDIDEWSFKNAKENCQMNNCERIEVVLGDHQTITDKSFDIIVANINKNVLIEQFSVYSDCLKSSGKLLISGFFETDQTELINKAKEHGFIFEQTYTKDEWAMIEFTA